MIKSWSGLFFCNDEEFLYFAVGDGFKFYSTEHNSTSLHYKYNLLLISQFEIIGFNNEEEFNFDNRKLLIENIKRMFDLS